MKEDESEILHLPDGLRIRAIREEDREADFVASTDAIDSYGERVEQTWILDRYKKNPIALFAHKRSELPIGRCTRAEVVSGQLECTIKFSTAELNPKAEQVWQNVKAGVLKAVSVGFIPHSIRFERENDRDVLILSDNELYEISVVPVPANADALAKARARMKAMADAVRSVAPATQPLNRGANGAADTETTMTEKELRDALDASKAENLTLKSRVEAAEAAAKDAEAKVATVSTERDKLATEKAALETELSTTAEARDKAIERAEKAEDGLIDAEIEALVGKKIKPTEKADFVRLRKESPDLCASMLAKRADLGLTENITVTETETGDVRALKRDAGVDLWSSITSE